MYIVFSQNVCTVWPLLARLQTIVEMKEAMQPSNDTYDTWTLRGRLIEGNSFEYVEPVLKTRQACVHICVVSRFFPFWGLLEMRSYVVDWWNVFRGVALFPAAMHFAKRMNR